MDERMEKQVDEHRIDAGRGVPLKQDSSEESHVSEVSSDTKERLDDRIRKAGI